MENFVNLLNTRGGAILVLLFVCFLAALASKWGVMGSEGMFHDAFIALLAMLSPAAVKAVADAVKPKDPNAAA